MARTVTTLTAILQMNNTKFKKGVSGSQKVLNKFQKQIRSFGGMIAGAFAITAISRFVVESAKLASIMEGVNKAFERIRPNIFFMQELQKATEGTVSELDLMRRAVMAANFKIPLKELGTLLAFATKRAQDTGESVDYLVNSIVIGIGRKSPLILDNLGISAIELKQKLDGVGIGAATVLDVAKAVGKVAAEEMKKAGEIVETSAIKYARMAATIKDMKVEFGNMANEIGIKVIPVMSAFLEQLKLVTRYWKSFKEGAEAARDEASMEGIGLTVGREESFIKFEAAMLQFRTGLGEEEALLKTINRVLVDNYKRLGEAVGSERAENKARAVIQFLEDWKKSIGDVINAPSGSLDALKEELDIVTKLWSAATDTSKIKALALEIQHLKDAIQEIKDIGKPHPLFLGGDEYTQSTWKELKRMVDSLDKGGGGLWDFLYIDDEELLGDEPVDKLIKQMREATNVSKELGNTVGVTLVSSFDDLGTAIGKALGGASDAISDLGKEISKNFGNILIMAGLNTGIWPLVVAGIVMQIGGGINAELEKGHMGHWTGPNGEIVYDPANLPGNQPVQHTVNFEISGNVIRGALDINDNLNNIGT